MLINHLLEKHSSSSPKKPAVWFENQWKTYSEIDVFSNKVANFLRTNGLRRGERAALMLRNSFDYIIVFFGILKAGGVVVPINTESTAGELRYLLDHSDSLFLFCASQYKQEVLTATEELSKLKFCIFDQAETDSGLPPPLKSGNFADIYRKESSNKPEIKTIDIDLALIVYTSGSTSLPKGVMLSHLNIVSNMRSIASYLHLSPEDRVMAVLPFFYIYGLSLLLSHFLCGGSVVIDNNFTYPNTVLETMKRLEVTGFAGVPYNFSLLLARSNLKKIDFPALRYVTQAGNAMAQRLQNETANAFSPAKLYVMYGATEAAPRISYLEPDMLSVKLGSVGKAVPNVEIIITDDSGKPFASGNEGEIAVRGANIMQGYWKDPENTAKVLKNGLYYTGDIGKMDSDGFLFITGREKEMIKIKGFQVSPREVEENILEISGIEDAAVIGFKDEINCNILKAFIVLNGGQKIEGKEILKHLSKKLSSYKIPKYIEFRAELPKNSSGKIDKLMLLSEQRTNAGKDEKTKQSP